MSAAGPPQGANCAPTGGVGARMSAAATSPVMERLRRVEAAA